MRQCISKTGNHRDSINNEKELILCMSLTWEAIGERIVMLDGLIDVGM